MLRLVSTRNIRGAEQAAATNVITKGAADKGGRCPDGTVTLSRQGDDLAVGWFGAMQGTTVVAYGTLKKK